MAFAALAAGILLVPRPSTESRPDPAGRPLRDLRVSDRKPPAVTTSEPQTPDDDPDPSLETAIAATVENDPAQALELAAHLAEDRPRGEAIGFALAQLAAIDPGAVFAWLEDSGESDEVRALAERAALPALAEQDPSRVARWIADGRVSARNQAAAVAATVQRWTQQDPPAAAAWVADFNDDWLLRGAMEPLLSLWTAQETSAPAAWIETLPAGPARDEACAAYAASLALSGPAEALRWAERIESPRLLADTRKRLGAK